MEKQVTHDKTELQKQMKKHEEKVEVMMTNDSEESDYVFGPEAAKFHDLREGRNSLTNLQFILHFLQTLL